MGGLAAACPTPFLEDRTTETTLPARRSPPIAKLECCGFAQVLLKHLLYPHNAELEPCWKIIILDTVFNQPFNLSFHVHNCCQNQSPIHN
ncbi:hypothetical protein AMECASPLE_031014 [Ameca splendens]|uniref:Uncharacterized protein n=1 Tax=Ameca splendens TaxID=208324 RepID=A0ABV1A2Z3_9TELE